MKKLTVFLSLAVSPWFIACNKKDNAPPQMKSPDKSISGVVFKTADNPLLTTDVTCIINADTIKAQFPYGISLSGLIPTITFLGKSISPSNKTTQNFNNLVTYTITAEDGSTRNYTLSGRPGQPLDTATLISGKWSVLEDSVYNDGNFYILLNGIPNYPQPGVYYGTAADYYDFNINDSVYISESVFTGVSAYELLPNSKLSVAALSVYPPADILTLSTNNATFFWAATSANGGQYARMLYLIK